MLFFHQPKRVHNRLFDHQQNIPEVDAKRGEPPTHSRYCGKITFTLGIFFFAPLFLSWIKVVFQINSSKISEGVFTFLNESANKIHYKENYIGNLQKVYRVGKGERAAHSITFKVYPITSKL